MKGKNIVLVGPAHPLRGGLATFNERFARELAKENSISILTFRLQYPGFLFPGESQFTDEPKPADLDIDVRLNSINPLNWIAAGFKYRKRKPDLIIFRWWMPFFGPCFGTVARIVKGNGHTRILVIADNIVPHEKRFIDKPFSKWFLGAADSFVTMSRKVLEDISIYDKDKPRQYNPHPLYDNFGEAPDRNESCKTLGLDPNCRYALFFGFIRKYKGLELLLQSWAQAKLDPSKFKLIIAGEFYEDPKPYEDLIRQLGLENSIIQHTRFIPNQQVAHYFSVSDLVTQTYLNATQSGVTQVAYHFDKPMLVTNVGGLAELVPHGKAGYVVKPDSAEIALALKDFFETEDKNRFAAGIAEMKQLFSWQKMAETVGKTAFPGE